jgi:hypothetical protein
MLQQAQLIIRASLLEKKTADLGDAQRSIAWGATIDIPTGTTDGKADRSWSDQGSIAASGETLLDLTGILTDVFGGSANFAKVKGILVKAGEANVNDLEVGGAGSNAFVGPFDAADNKVMVRPGGYLALWAPKAGWTVTAGTGDQLRLGNAGAGSAVAYDIIVIGTSA